MTGDLSGIKKSNDSTYYLCGGSEGSGFILQSVDGGSTWQTLRNDFPWKIFDIDFMPSGRQVAVSEGINFNVTDDNWFSYRYYTPSNDQFPQTGYDSDMFSVDMINDSIGYSCGGTVYQHGVIYKTTDGGVTWRYTYKPHKMRSIIMLNENQGYTAGYGVIYKTTDGGTNWNLTNAGNDYYTCLTHSTADNCFAGGYQGSILKATGIDDWNTKNKCNQPFEKRVHFNCINFFNNLAGAAAGENGVIYITTDGGNNWSEGYSFEGSSINSIILVAENQGYAAADNGRLFHFQF